MIFTDTLAPIITEKGIATICTADGMKAMSAGLTFHTIRVESTSTDTILYGIQLLYKYGTVWTTGETMVRGIDGWLPLAELYSLRQKGELNCLIRGLKTCCLICNKPYRFSTVQSFCSQECFITAKRSRLFLLKPLTASNVNNALIEEWHPIASIRRAAVYHVKADAIKVSSLDGTDSLYVNGILFSCNSLQTKVDSKE